LTINYIISSKTKRTVNKVRMSHHLETIVHLFIGVRKKLNRTNNLKLQSFNLQSTTTIVAAILRFYRFLQPIADTIAVTIHIYLQLSTISRIKLLPSV